jgi:hypothetical protein
LHLELEACQLVYGVPIGDEFQSLAGELLKMGEGPEEREHTRLKSPCAANGVADDGALNDIHDKPDIVIDALDLDVSFSGGKGIRGFVVVVESELGDDGGGRVDVSGNHAMGYGDAVDIEHDTLRLPKRKAAIHDISQAKAEDMRGELAKVEIHAFSGERGKIHLEKVSHEFPIDVEEFEPIRVFLIFGPVVRGKRCERGFVELAMLAYTLMYEESLSVFDSCKSVSTVRALQEKWRHWLTLKKAVIAYLA